MQIKIDKRERDLYANCEERINTINDAEIHLVPEMLPLGDIIICDDNGNEFVIIERKTLNDLASSIRDGRYKEQGYRLNECSVHNHNIIYLVEGNLQSYNGYKAHLERKALLSSFVSLTYFKGFSLHRTENVNETAEWILSYASKLQRENGKSFYDIACADTSEGVQNKVTNSYVDVSSRVKKNNVNVDNIASIMLSQIPGVSAAVASAVMSKYGRLKDLIDDLTNNPYALEEIMIPTKTNKMRKISKTSTHNIYSYLVAGEKQEITVNTE
jgi:crossover junction endonuclease MUS81